MEAVLVAAHPGLCEIDPGLMDAGGASHDDHHATSSQAKPMPMTSASA